MIAVSIGPGLTEFTRIFRDASSSAAIFTIALIAALLAEYAAMEGAGTEAEVDESITTELPSLRIGINFDNVKYAPFRFTFITSSNISSVVSSILANLEIPALIMSVSI